MIGRVRVTPGSHAGDRPKIRRPAFRKYITSLANRLRWQKSGRLLFRKYVVSLLGIVCIALLSSGLLEMWFTYKEYKASLIRIQQEQAEAAAVKISQFIKEIESQIGWVIQLPWSTSALEERRFDGLRLLRQVPAITELIQLDGTGREQLRLSRVEINVFNSHTDFSQDPNFIEAMAHKVYYGPVNFRYESEPYMTLAMAGTRRDAGVAIAEVNLKLIWDIVSEIKIGEHGEAYVVDGQGRLIAHPDISLVLRNINLSMLPQLMAGRSRATDLSLHQIREAKDFQGRQVLTAYAPVAPLGWFVFVELPREEAYASLYGSVIRSAIVLLGGAALALIFSLVLARRMIVPIQELQDGAARIGSGDLSQRIVIKTGDELEALGDQFNSMAEKLQESYGTLERRVAERTHQLELANLAKSRFLAVASHDLRQPLHALGLFVGQLRNGARSIDRERIVDHINTAVAEMNELFNALLDISKLDAGVLAPNFTEFPIARLLQRLETTFAQAATKKGLRLRMMPSAAWVRSDALLLERILLNLVSNAVRYTSKGGVLVACRQRGETLRIEIWDSGPGIPEGQRENIFGEFYQIAGTQRDRQGGLGLGLSIVDRLRRLLGHSIELSSIVDRGSRFTITVPSVVAQKLVEPVSSPLPIIDHAQGKLVVVIDDDALVLEGTGGLLRSWGCRVITANSYDAALREVIGSGQQPDVIISDYHLSDGKTGVEIIERLRAAFETPIPAFLISGDVAPERLQQARNSGYHLLHKPLAPMTLRAMLNRHLKTSAEPEGSITVTMSSSL